MKQQKRINLDQLMAETGHSEEEVMKIMWPDTSQHTRYVLMQKWRKQNHFIAGLDKLCALAELFGTDRISKLIIGEEDDNTGN